MGEDAEAVAPFRILVVCSANVCRSPVVAELLAREFVAVNPDARIEVQSRGVWAVEGEAACAEAVALAGLESLKHSSRRLAPADIAAADLILTAEQAHRGAVVEMSLSARRRVFTMREAAALAQWLADGSPVPEGRDIPPAPPAPLNPQERLVWWVAELDAGRGLASMGADTGVDIPDAPSGADHAAVVAQLGEAVRALGGGGQRL